MIRPGGKLRNRSRLAELVTTLSKDSSFTNSLSKESVILVVGACLPSKGASSGTGGAAMLVHPHQQKTRSEIGLENIMSQLPDVASTSEIFFFSVAVVLVHILSH